MDQQTRRAVGLTLLLWAACVGVVLWLWIDDPREELRHPAVLFSAWLAVGYWAAAGRELIRYGRIAQWFVATTGWSVARMNWALSAVTLWLHLGIAMHAAHGWSLDRALAHVATADGSGIGFWFSLGVAAVWAADAAWLAAHADSYLGRPRWVGWAVHGLIAFFVFNAAVVFVGWPGRAVGLAVFGWLGWAWWRR